MNSFIDIASIFKFHQSVSDTWNKKLKCPKDQIATGNYCLAQAMNKENFGVLMTKLANELPEYPYATDEEAAAMRKLQQDRDFNDEDDEMVKKPLSLDDPTDNPEKESSNSRTGTIPSLAKLGGSLFKK